MKLTFFGGAKAVAGANYLLESGDTKILIDCGLHQGSHFAERKNFDPFPYNPKDISAVFITHPHIDHIGLLPKLRRDGFRGLVYSTPPTRDFAELLLLDSEHILKSEAEREGRPPLYSLGDVRAIMDSWKGIQYHEVVHAEPFIATLFNAGHILGSAIVRIEAEGKTIAFSGDLGNTPAPMIEPTEKLEAADYCVIESAYGDRLHEGGKSREEHLEDAIEETVNAGGTLMIPAFAMERTQDLLYHLNILIEKGKVPRVPIFIDSPLAIKLTAVYKKYEDYFNPDTSKIIKAGDDILNFPGLRFTLTTEQSKEINDVHPPKVIIAGSGMSQAGRILFHEMRYLPDPKSTILFVGYQSVGSLGRKILEGAKEVRIMGEQIPVRCRVRVISGYSAHADQSQLLSWLKPMRQSLKKVFVVQGDPEASEVLAQKIRDDLAINAIVPEEREEHVL